jgi:hypothetical protein
MRLVERHVIRIANFADQSDAKRLLNASATTRGTVGTHLVLELIRRIRNDACPIAWAGVELTNAELCRDELSNEAYSAAVTYCMSNTAAVVERMNVDGLRSWLEVTLSQPGGCRLFVPGLWPLADWVLRHVMNVAPLDQQPHVSPRRLRKRLSQQKVKIFCDNMGGTHLVVLKSRRWVTSEEQQPLRISRERPPPCRLSFKTVMSPSTHWSTVVSQTIQLQWWRRWWVGEPSASMEKSG